MLNVERPKSVYYDDNSDPELPTCSIIGSLRYMHLINRVIDDFQTPVTGIIIPILAPSQANYIGEVDGYKLLDTDTCLDPLVLEKGYLTKFLQSTFGYIADPGGYIGNTSRIEIGIAVSTGVPLIAQEPINPNLTRHPENTFWRFICNIMPVMSPGEIKRRISQGQHVRDFGCWVHDRDERAAADIAAYFLLELEKLKEVPTNWEAPFGLGLALAQSFPGPRKPLPSPFDKI